MAGAAGIAAAPAQAAQAKKALLVPSDLPASWTSSASTTVSGASGFTGAPQLAHCIGVPANLIKVQPPQFNSLQFSDKGGTEQVQNTISVFPSASYAREEYAAVASHKTPRCLAALFDGASGSGSGSGSGAQGSGSSVGGSASVTRVSSPKNTSAYAIVLSGSSGSCDNCSSGASSPTTRTETVFFVHGQYGDAISIVTLGSQSVPASLVDHLTSEAQGRL